MCGRYVLHEDLDEIAKRFQASNNLIRHLEDNYNIFPSSLNPVITRNSPISLELIKWGLIPRWAKDPKIGFKLANARDDSVATQPSFKESFQKYRCLVPASGFYEWKETSEGKVPYYISSRNGFLFAFAGLYSVWKDAEKIDVRTYTIITTKPSAEIEEIHNRMPVILGREGEEVWLDPRSTDSDLFSLFKPYTDLEVHRVSTDVNSPQNNHPNLIKPLATPI